jgi:hypothetical protein
MGCASLYGMCQPLILLGLDTRPILECLSAHARVLSTCVRFPRIGFRHALYTKDMQLPSELNQLTTSPCPSEYAQVCHLFSLLVSPVYLSFLLSSFVPVHHLYIYSCRRRSDHQTQALEM